MTKSGRYLEVQGTGESRPFTPEELTAILDLCSTGIQEAIEIARVAMTTPLDG
jgi:ribonuclease PH